MRSPAGDSKTHRDGTTASLAAAARASSLKEPSTCTEKSGKTSSPLARMTDRVGMACTRTTKMRVKKVLVGTVTVFEPSRVSPWNNGPRVGVHVCASLRVCVWLNVLRFARVYACLCAGLVSVCSSCHIKAYMKLAPLCCPCRLSSPVSDVKTLSGNVVEQRSDCISPHLNVPP